MQSTNWVTILGCVSRHFHFFFTFFTRLDWDWSVKLTKINCDWFFFSPLHPTTYTTTRPNIRFESDSDDEDMVKQTRALPPAPKIKGPNFDIQSAIKRRVQKQMTSPEPRWSVTSLESRWSETSLESRRSAISPEPNRSMTSSEPQLQDESQRQPGTTLSGFARKWFIQCLYCLSVNDI